jgi:uncharacterized protein (DUF3820 family)
MADQIIEFGKHSMSTFKDILEKDPSYARWLTKQPLLIGEEAMNYLKENLPEDEYIMSFGKYKGKPLEYIKRIDFQYIQYLKKNDYVQSKMLKLKKLLDEPIL